MSGASQRPPVAVVVVHGSGSVERGEAARSVASLLAWQGGGASSFFERHLLLPEDGEALAAVRPDDPVKVEILDEDRRRLAAVHDTSLIEGRAGPRAVDVYELRWADLVGRAKPSPLAVLRALIEAAPRPIEIGAAALRDDASPSHARRLATVHRPAQELVGWILPTLTVAWIVVSSAALPLQLPDRQHGLVGRGIAGLILVSLSVVAVYRLAPRLRRPALPLLVMVLLGVVLLALNILRPLEKVASMALVGAWTIAAGSGAAIVLRTFVSARAHRWRWPFLWLGLLGIAGALALPPEVSASGACARCVVGWLSAQAVWLVLVGIALSACACVLFEIGARFLLRGEPADAPVRRAVATASVGLSVSLLGQWFVNALLLAIATDGRLASAWVPVRQYLDDSRGLRLVLTDTVPLLIPGGLLLTAMIFASALGPSLLAEVRDHGDAAPIRYRDPDRAAARREGVWLTWWWRVAGVVLRRAFVIVIAIPLCSPLAIHLSGVVGAAVLIWTFAIPAALSLLALIGRSAGMIAGAWPYLATILDLDVYERPGASPSWSARANVLARGLTLLRHLASGPKAYAGVVVVAQGQGTVIAADLLHAAEASIRGSLPVTLVTLGSPLRQVHRALWPGRFRWVDNPAAAAAAMGLRRWVNLFTAGDYLGRSLQAPEEDRRTYDPDPDGSTSQATFRDRCIGPGAQFGYLHHREVGKEIHACVEET
jgi:hypothetical protein